MVALARTLVCTNNGWTRPVLSCQGRHTNLGMHPRLNAPFQIKAASRMNCLLDVISRKADRARLQVPFAAQLNKAQDAFIAWQNAGKGSAERRRLQPEIEEECKSIAWQVNDHAHHEIHYAFANPLHTVTMHRLTAYRGRVLMLAAATSCEPI